MDRLNSLVRQISSQLGLSICSDLFFDSSDESSSEPQCAEVLKCITKYLPDYPLERVRLLELGACDSDIGHLLQQRTGLEATLSDVSEAALRHGLRKVGDSSIDNSIDNVGKAVAADPHTLPFSDNYFDIVFISSALHYTCTPEVIVKEMLRVLNTGGVLFLYSEPCARALAFNSFQGNDPEHQTEFEQHLQRRGLLHTVTSVLAHSRPESLLGIVRNPHVRAGDYIQMIEADAEIEELHLSFESLLESFEQELLKHSQLPEFELSAWIKDRLTREFSSASSLLGERERCLTQILPDENQIRECAAEVARLIKRIPEESEQRAQRMALAELFGATVQIIARKNGQSSDRIEDQFCRPLKCSHGIYVDDWVQQRIGRQTLPQACPNLQEDPLEAVARVLHPAQWETVETERGMREFKIRGSSACIKAPFGGQEGILLLRFFAVEYPGKCYQIIFDTGQERHSYCVCQGEVLLFCHPFNEAPSQILVNIENEDGNPLEFPGALRVGDIRFIRTSKSST